MNPYFGSFPAGVNRTLCAALRPVLRRARFCPSSAVLNLQEKRMPDLPLLDYLQFSTQSEWSSNEFPPHNIRCTCMVSEGGGRVRKGVSPKFWRSDGSSTSCSIIYSPMLPSIARSVLAYYIFEHLLYIAAHNQVFFFSWHYSSNGTTL